MEAVRKFFSELTPLILKYSIYPSQLALCIRNKFIVLIN